MQKFIKENIYLLPIIALVFDFASQFVKFDYVIIGNLVGTSIVTDIVFFYFFYYNPRFCWLTRVSTIALLLINIIDLLGTVIDYSLYNKLFHCTVSFLAIGLSIIFELNKRLIK